MKRIHDLLNKPKQFTQEDEVLIHVRNGEVVALFHDGEDLVEISGKVDEDLNGIIQRMKASE